MEPDRAEMSVGSRMVNGDHLANGVTTNGSSITTKSQVNTPSAVSTGKASASTAVYVNGENIPLKKEDEDGIQPAGSILQDAPPELLQALSSEFYLPMAKLISRSAQTCWNDMARLVERLASMPVSTQPVSNGAVMMNDQSEANLDKKDLLLNFAKEHKDVFIKLLVLLQWSKKSNDVRKTIELNLWLQQRRQAFNNATGMLGAMMRGLADSQVPNPDLYTASEVLATGNVSSMPKLNYIPQPHLSSKQILRLLRRLDTLLCTRMTLAEDVPSYLQNYHIHDGRVTFTVMTEFSFDVSIASEDPQAKFGMVDFEFLFSPTPSIPDGLHDEITYIANTALDKDGFTGVYDFLHNLTLSYKINELAKQARRLAQGLWNGHLRVEVLRRTLVVQYWLKRSTSKSWLEIGIQSGHKEHASEMSVQQPGLSLRWLREGKLANSDEIYLDVTQLSIEKILLQTVAQHTNFLFDAMFERASLLPLYDTAELELNQSASMEDPAECFLQIQLSKIDTLRVSMEPTAGLLVLSPVNERTNRLQSDLSRSKSLVDEFVNRLSGLRSNTAESNLIKVLPNSQWQRLGNVRINPLEAEKLFGQAVVNISVIRLQEWGHEWSLVITQSATGDGWWLAQSTQPNVIAGSRITKIVDNHPLYLIGSPKPSYLERLADYTTGVISLRCNAEYLNSNHMAWRLPDKPAFDEESRLPTLQFTRSGASSTSNSLIKHRQPALNNSQSNSDTASLIHLTYHGTARISNKVIMIAKTSLVAEPSVLRDLASSKLDQSVAIIPSKQQVMIKLEVDAGSTVVAGVMSKISHLDNIVACASAVKKSTEHTLQSLSLSSITILYHKQPDLSLSIDFGQQSNEVAASFLPAQTNPHQHLSQWVAKLMRRKSTNSSLNLSNVFVVLRITLPIMSYLQKVQTPVDLSGNKESGTENHLRVHVLHRQPTAYGLHYYADSSNFVRDDTSPETPKRLLARFEVLAMKRGERLMWMVRPAIEEFNSYNRPSYTAKSLREKLDRDIFKKQNSSWLALDGGAACPSENPEQLLASIHQTIVEWAKDAVKAELAKDKDVSIPNGTHVSETTEKPAKPVPPPPKVQNPQQRPNNMQRPPQGANQQRSQNFNNRNQGSRSEVITLD